MTEISIIIPVFNAEKYISKCIDSLINQTFSDIEIVCVNDGSKDNTLSILNDYANKDKRVKVISQLNQGPAVARNTGLKNSSSKYLMFCDSDDWYESNMCEVMYKTIEKNNVDVVICQNYFEYDNNLDDYLRSKREVDNYFNPNLKGYYLIDESRFSVPVMLWNKIFRRDVLDKYNIVFPQGNKQDDTCFWLMTSFVIKNFYYLPIKLYHYLLRPNSVACETIDGRANSEDGINVAEKVFEFCKLQGLANKYKDDIIKVFLQQLNFVKNLFSEEENRLFAKRSNNYIKKISSQRIIYFGGDFISINRFKIFKLLFHLYFYKFKYFFGSKAYKQKKYNKIQKLQSLVNVIKKWRTL